MEEFHIRNQISTLIYALTYIPYLIDWFVALAFNIYWFGLVFEIARNLQIYTKYVEKKYMEVVGISILSTFYIYGVILWNPVIVNILIFNHMFLDPEIYKNISYKARTTALPIIEKIMNFDSSSDSEEDSIQLNTEEASLTTDSTVGSLHPNTTSKGSLSHDNLRLGGTQLSTDDKEVKTD